MGKKARKKSKKSSKKRNTSFSRKKPIGWFLGLHHIIPSSRDGSNDKSNMYPTDRWEPYSEKHEAYHIIYVNLTPQEAIEVTRPHIGKSGKLFQGFFNLEFTVEKHLVEGEIREVVRMYNYRPDAKKKKEAWLLLFRDFDGQKAIEWIEREFVRKEWLSPPANVR